MRQSLETRLQKLEAMQQHIDPYVVAFVYAGETEGQALERMEIDPACVTPERCIFIMEPEQ